MNCIFFYILFMAATLIVIFIACAVISRFTPWYSHDYLWYYAIFAVWAILCTLLIPVSMNRRMTEKDAVLTETVQVMPESASVADGKVSVLVKDGDSYVIKEFSSERVTFRTGAPKMEIYETRLSGRWIIPIYQDVTEYVIYME